MEDHRILEIMQSVESYLGRNLTSVEDKRLFDYLADKPISTDPQYLAELHSLGPTAEWIVIA